MRSCLAFRFLNSFIDEAETLIPCLVSTAVRQREAKTKMKSVNHSRKEFSSLYLSRYLILIEIISANQSEFKFLSLPLKSGQNVSQENQPI